MGHDSHEPTAEAADASAAFEANLATYAGTAPARRDGWTPFARRLFLEVLSETGRVSAACECAQLTKQSAYALRARDPLFAAGWDAACELARAPLADALYEKALDGVTETITKDGEVVAERHRFDSRLSIAVLHRLDKRCDRALEVGAQHLALVRRWDEWLALVGRGEEHAARAILETARHGQLGQLPESENPTDHARAALPGAARERDSELNHEGAGLPDRCWQDEQGAWCTDFPPPADFDGYEEGEWGSGDYVRECSPEEAALLDASMAAAAEKCRAQEEALRVAWFRMLSNDDRGPDPDLEPELDEASAPE
jgi:hypothetical protein